MGKKDKGTGASTPDSADDDYDAPPVELDPTQSSGTPPPPEQSSSSSPPSSPPPSTPPPSPPKKSPPPAPPSEDDGSPPAPPGDSESVSPPVNKPSPVTPTTPALPDSTNKPTPSGSASASGGGSSSSPLLSTPNGQSSSKGGSSNNAGAIAGVVVGVVLFVVIVGCCVAVFRRKKKKRQTENQIWDNAYKYPDKHHVVNIPPPMQLNSAPYQGSGWAPPSPGPSSGFNYTTSGGGGGGGGQQHAVHPGAASPQQMAGGGGPGQKCFSFEDLVAATNGFASSNMLGQGGFGYVHKGVLPATGKVVAVKSLKSGSGQGEREFQSEVEIISRVHHRHLVSLVGYCISAEKRLLVYEFVPNNNLEFHLYKSGNILDFSTRLRIALGSAKGLAYLHEDCHPRIIHRDIKASNILLDYNFEAQVADFGLAKLTTDTNTHVSTRVMGTFGYLAPEYASSGKLTEKSDVFSFGVMLLELITGRRPVDPNDHNMMEDSLVDWARPLLSKALAEKNFDGLADPRLERNYNSQDMLSMVACAASSIRHSSKKRPRMSQIVRALEGQMSLDNLLDGGATKTTHSSEYDTAAYNADLSRFREIALGGSGNSSNATSTNPSSEFNINIHSSNDR